MIIRPYLIYGHGISVNLEKRKSGTNMQGCIVFQAFLHKILTV